MVQRTEKLNLAATRALFSSFSTTEEMVALYRRIMDGALAQQDYSWIENEDDREKAIEAGADRALEYQKLAANLLFPKPPRASAKSAKVDLGDLSSVDGCIEGIATIARAQVNGDIAMDEAEDLRKTVMAAATIHRSKTGDALMSALEEAGSIPAFMGAAETTEQAKERFAAFLDAQSDN